MAPVLIGAWGCAAVRDPAAPEATTLTIEPPATTREVAAPPAPREAVAPRIPAPATSSGSASAASARRWLYRLRTSRDGVEAGEKVLAFSEVSRRTMVGSGPPSTAATEVLELHADGVGGRATLPDFAELGLSSAPVEAVLPRWTLLERQLPAGVSAWLLQTEGPVTQAALQTALRTRPDFPPQAGLRSEPADPPMDRPYVYRKTVAGLASTCVGYVHPAPQTGDFYDVQRCYAPGVGMTKLVLRSVWGGYDLELAAGPPKRTLPVTPPSPSPSRSTSPSPSPR